MKRLTFEFRTGDDARAFYDNVDAQASVSHRVVDVYVDDDAQQDDVTRAAQKWGGLLATVEPVSQ